MAEEIKRKEKEAARIKKLVEDLYAKREANAGKSAPDGLGGELREACCIDDFEVVRTIVDEWEGHALIDEVDIDGWSPIHWACKKGSFECVKYILENTWINEHETDRKKKKDVNLRIDLVDGEGQTLLMMAAISGNVDLVVYLISKGANKNLQNEDGFSAYLWAAYKGQLKVLKILEDKQVNTLLRTRGNLTALQVAIVGKNKECIEYLQHKHKETAEH